MPPAHVKHLAEARGPAFPAGRLLIPSPAAIAAVLAAVPAGEVLRLGALRARLAAAHGADYACPVTAGLYLRLLAEAALEEGRVGGPGAVPVWRVVRDDGALLDRLPGGPAGQAARLRAEGVPVERAGGGGGRAYRVREPPPRAGRTPGAR